MKKKIIFVQFVKFLDFHHELFEVKYLKKDFIVEVHDLSFLFNNKSHKNYNYLKQKSKVIKFYNLFNWYNLVSKNLKKYKNNLYLFYTGSPLNFSFLFFHFLLLLKKINIVLVKQNTLPNLNIIKDYSLKENLIFKCHRLFNRKKHVLYENKFKIINFFLGLMSLFLPPKIIFTNGKIDKKRFESKFPRSQIVSLHSWDASKVFLNNTKKIFSRKKYGVYLTPFSIKSASDSNTYGYKKLENAKKVFYDVNKGLGEIEQKYKKKILIGLHPRGEDKISKLKELGNRQTFKYKTLELIKNSNFVITHMSIAISYAILFNKPLIFIHTKEHKKNLFYMRYNKHMANFFSCESVNIENISNISIPDKISRSMKSRYDYFKNTYLLSNDYKKLPNYKIIKKTI